MKAAPVRQQPDLLGVAIYAALLVLGLVLVAGFLSQMMTAVEQDEWTVVVATAAMVAGTGGGFCLCVGVALYYQAKPAPLSRGRDSLVWRPPLVCRIADVVIVVAFSTAAVALAITPNIGIAGVPLLISAYVGALLACVTGLRLLVVRLEADDWGIRYRGLLTTVHFPWDDVGSLETRGKSTLSKRIVAITKQGRERTLWVLDPRISISRDTARLLVAELEAVRQSATNPGV